MIAIKIKLNQTIIKMFRVQEMCLPVGLLTVTSDVWCPPSFLASGSGACRTVVILSPAVSVEPCAPHIAELPHLPWHSCCSRLVSAVRPMLWRREGVSYQDVRSFSEPLCYSLEGTRLFYFHHKTAFLINQTLTYSGRNLQTSSPWCSFLCEALSWQTVLVSFWLFTWHSLELSDTWHFIWEIT